VLPTCLAEPRLLYKVLVTSVPVLAAVACWSDDHHRHPQRSIPRHEDAGVAGLSRRGTRRRQWSVTVLQAACRVEPILTAQAV
jgi:hypothetical protein